MAMPLYGVTKMKATITPILPQVVGATLLQLLSTRVVSAVVVDGIILQISMTLLRLRPPERTRRRIAGHALRKLGWVYQTGEASERRSQAGAQQ